MDNKTYHELDCDIVRDLLPLYHDSVVSETTMTAVRQHISTCNQCRSELEALQEELPCDQASTPVTQKKFANMMQSQKRKRILWTGISAVLIVALLVGAYFGQFQLPIFDVPQNEITVHRVYRYKTDEGYKFFLLYSAPYYDYMHLGTDIESNGTTLVFKLQKPLISKKYEALGTSGQTEVYSCGWTSNDVGGRDFTTFETVKFGETVVWTEENSVDPIPDYVYAHEEMNSCTGKVTAWTTEVNSGYLGATYADGKTVIWDLDGKVISTN